MTKTKTNPNPEPQIIGEWFKTRIIDKVTGDSWTQYFETPEDVKNWNEANEQFEVVKVEIEFKWGFE